MVDANTYEDIKNITLNLFKNDIHFGKKIYSQSDIIVYEKRHCGKRLCADVQLNFDITKTLVERDSPLQEWCKMIVRNNIQKSNFTLSNLGFPLLGNKKTLRHCIPFKSLIHMMYLNHDQCTIMNNKSVCQTKQINLPNTF